MQNNNRNNFESGEETLIYSRYNLFRFVSKFINNYEGLITLKKKLSIALLTISDLEERVFISNNEIDNQDPKSEKDKLFPVILEGNITIVDNEKVIKNKTFVTFVKKIKRINSEQISAKYKLKKIFIEIDKFIQIKRYLQYIINKKKDLLINPNEHKVFLSYAYADRVYTFALFLYLRSKGLYLHVDWMHHPKLSGGTIIKSTLASELKTSDQLLFLDTLNSQLQIKRTTTIRQWCSWEIGQYYQPSKAGSKFIHSPYFAVSQHSCKKKNEMLDDFAYPVGIKGGLFY